MAASGRTIFYGVIALLVLAIGGAILAYAARDNLIRYTLNPGRSFGEGAQATSPNYAKASTWAALPANPTKPVDTFFIYPTVYFSC